MNCPVQVQPQVVDVNIPVTNPISNNLQAVCNANPINTTVGNPVLWNTQVTGGLHLDSKTECWALGDAREVIQIYGGGTAQVGGL